MGLHRLQQQKSCTVHSAGTANKGVWYLQEAEMNMWRRQQHQGVATIWLTEEERYGDGGLLAGVDLARSHPSSTLYFGIVILCTLTNKAWFTYNAPRRLMVTLSREACKHLGNGAQAIVTAMWALNAEGTMESADWETLKSNLADYASGDSALTQAVHKIDAALVRRSADPTALKQLCTRTVWACLDRSG